VLTIYGIVNCDSCRKARKWLEQHGTTYRFHDLRADGLDRGMLERWAKAAGWQSLLNTRSTSWRALPQDARSDVDERKSISLMLEHPTLVKRPVAELGQTVLVGFSADRYAAMTKQAPRISRCGQ